MEFTGLEDLIKERFSCREFNDKELSLEIVEKIISVARLCPSACNSQPWKMLYTVDKKKTDEITKFLQDENRNTFLSKAKGYIALVDCQAKLRSGIEGRFSNDHFVKYDIGQMIAYITLTAKTLGVDSCIIGWINKDLNKYLGLEDNQDCNIVVALGYSDKCASVKVRKPSEEIAKEL